MWLAMPELAVLAVAESIQRAVGTKNARVRATSDANCLDVRKRLNEARQCLRTSLAMSELSVAARSPRINASTAAYGTAVLRAAFEL